MFDNCWYLDTVHLIMNPAGKRTRNAKRAAKQDGNQRPTKRSCAASPLTHEEPIASDTKSSPAQTEQLAPPHESESGSQETLHEEKEDADPEAKPDGEQAADEKKVENYSQEQLESDLKWIPDVQANHLLAICAREIPAVAHRVQEARRTNEIFHKRLLDMSKSNTERVVSYIIRW